MSGSWERQNQIIDILIATPISGAELMFYEVAENNFQLIFPKDMKVVRAKFPEPMIDISRDKAIALAIQNGAKYIFFLDADIIPPVDVLVRLLSHYSEKHIPSDAIVGGLYVRRHNPPFNEMLKLRTDGIPGLVPIQDGQYPPGSLVECDAIATGCMLLPTETIEKVKPFKLTIDGRQARDRYFLWTEFNLPPPVYSEDFQFCVRARESGVRVFCDTSVRVKHAGVLKLLPGGQGGLSVQFMGDTSPA